MENLVFGINNIQEEYAKCVKVIRRLQGEKVNMEACSALEVYLHTDQEEEGSIAKVLAKLAPKMEAPAYGTSLKKITDIKNVGKKTTDFRYFIFYVKTGGDDSDIANIQYFCLLRQRYPQAKLLLHSYSHETEFEYAAARFLWFESKKNRDSYFIYANGSIKKITYQNHGVMRKLFPLMEINTSEDTIYFWRQSVESMLRKMGGRERMGEIIPVKYLHSKAYTEGEEEKIKNSQYKLAQQSKEYFCMFSCKEFFCSSNYSAKKGTVRFRMDLYESSQFWEIVRSMPVLAFYIFCMLFGNDKSMQFKKGDGYNYSLLRELVLIARDMADGILQLLENIYHSDSQKGFFSIRIHDDASKNLKEKYGNYFIQYGNEQEGQSYLELQILDYSNQTIVETFLRDKDPNACLSSIKSFFAPDGGEEDYWNRYNQVGENSVHHYGLQIFDSLVTVNQGCFIAVSSHGEADRNRDIYCNYPSLPSELENGETIPALYIPGTQYSIILPFGKSTAALNTGVNADINYSSQVNNEYRVVNANQLIADFKQNWDEEPPVGNGYQEYYIRSVERSFAKLEEFYSEYSGAAGENGSGLVIKVDSGSIMQSNIEVFCKTIMLFLIRESKRRLNLMIYNCEEYFFVDVTRMFAIFYNKQGENSVMQNLQLYLSGKSLNEEFILTGQNIQQAITVAEKLAFARGIHAACIKTLLASLKKRPCGENARKDDEARLIIPFDLLQEEGREGDPTLFERGVRCILEAEIQKVEFGNLMKDTHVRLGSKIHINNFYEAELIFHNNYYTIRFAFLIVKELKANRKLDENKELVLVGYETYSEMLLYQMKKYFTYINSNLKVSYIIYEYRQKESFRNFEEIGHPYDAQFVFIVPINSTLTTHNKLHSMLEGRVRQGNPEYQLEMHILDNFALILNRDSIREGKEYDNQITEQESRFWSGNKNRVITVQFNKTRETKIKYFVSVSGHWENPLLCGECFPESDYLEEKPLIQTNKESVIPMHKIGFLDTDPNLEEIKSTYVKSYDEEENTRRVKALKSALIHQHIIRSDNHFEFYIRTEKYFAEQREKIISWLGDLGEQRKERERNTKDTVIYNIIVAPIHFSNTGFIDEVNNSVFDNAALVLHFDIEKEFRENVKTKYSSILGLYLNLSRVGQKAEINFHFVDDTIITGGTVQRAGSLMHSIFPDRAFKPESVVRVHIFATITLILSRISDHTVTNYICNRDNYRAYVHLYISSMRSHEGACVLCNYEEECRNLSISSSTGRVYEYWSKKSRDYRLQKIEKYAGGEAGVMAYREMLCSHLAQLEFSKLGYGINDPEKVEQVIICKLFLGESRRIPEMVISYITVISRPFLSFRKSIKEAIFGIMLAMLHYILSGKKKAHAPKYYKDLYQYMDQHREEFGNLGCEDSMAMTLLNQLTGLGANYVIRMKTVELIQQKIKELVSKESEGALLHYLNLIKRNICSSTDEIKCVFIEYYLLHGLEYGKQLGFRKCLIEDERILLYRQIYLENTRVLYDAVENLDKHFTWENSTEADVLEHINSGYYYENFRNILAFNGKGKLKQGDIKEQLESFRGNAWNQIAGTVYLYKHLAQGRKWRESDKKKDIRDFYGKFLVYLMQATGAADAKLAFERAKTGQYVILCTGLQAFMVQDPGTEKLIAQAKGELELDTYLISRQDKGIRVLVKFCDYKIENSQMRYYNIGDIYLSMEFEQGTAVKEVLWGLRNLLVFRSSIINNLKNDFSNSLMGEWLTEEHFKTQMVKARANDHTDKDDLRKQLMNVVSMSSEKILENKNFFLLLINTYIGRINLQLLAGLPHFKFHVGECYGYLHRNFLKDMLRAVEVIMGAVLLDQKGEIRDHDLERTEFMQCELRTREDCIPALNRVAVLLTEVVISAVKYGSGIVCTKAGEEKHAVYFYKDGRYLVIKNQFSDKLAEKREQIRDAKLRKGAGISLSVAYEFFNSYYEDSVDDGVYIKAAVEPGGRKKYFEVGIPIFAEEML